MSRGRNQSSTSGMLSVKPTRCGHQVYYFTPAVVIILYNIATIHMEWGEEEEAMRCHRETLRVERCSLGPGHAGVAVTLQHHTGLLDQQRGNRMQALLRYYHEALMIQRHGRG